MDREKKEKDIKDRQKEKEKIEQQGKGVKFKLKKCKDQDSTTSLENKVLFKYDESSDEGKILFLFRRYLTWGLIWHESIFHKALRDGIYFIIIFEKEPVFPF